MTVVKEVELMEEVEMVMASDGNSLCRRPWQQLAQTAMATLKALLPEQYPEPYQEH